MMRFARRGCSRPSGRLVIAKTRLMSAESRRASSARFPTKPLAPASRAIFGSPSAMRASDRKRVTIPHIMHALFILAEGLVLGDLAGAAAAVTDADRVQVYHEFRAVF